MIASEQQQVERDDPRVQVGEHGDAADHRLGRDAEREHEREPRAGRGGRLRQAATNVAIATATSTKVSVRLPNSMAAWTSSAPCGRERRVGAARPGRAAEPGAGQPDRAAGHDEHDVGDQAWPSPAAQPAVGASDAARGSRGHSHVNVLAVSDGADDGPDQQHQRGRARRRVAVDEGVAHRLAERAGGQPAGRRCAEGAVRRRGEHDRAAGQQQQVERLAAASVASARSTPATSRPSEANAAVPSSDRQHGARAAQASRVPAEQPAPTSEITTICSSSTSSSAPTLPSSSPERGSGEAPSRLMHAVAALEAGRDRQRGERRRHHRERQHAGGEHVDGGVVRSRGRSGARPGRRRPARSPGSPRPAAAARRCAASAATPSRPGRAPAGGAAPPRGAG